jgi:hypothetical protein
MPFLLLQLDRVIAHSRWTEPFVVLAGALAG